jgi:Ca2+-binding EF-hand superfamily protein
MELFRDWDADGDGLVSAADLFKGFSSLGVHASEEEVKAVFDRWDTDGSGGLDFKELDRAIRGAPGHNARHASTTASAKELQRALKERLQGK